MRGVKDFLKDSLPGMVEYVLVISTVVSDPYGAYPGPYGSYTGPPVDIRERLTIIDALRQRGVTMPVLDREAVPLLPHLLDVPRHLAVVTSAVIRASKGKQHRRKPSELVDAQLDEFIARCFEVEETALHRVSQLASRAAENPPASPIANRHSASEAVSAHFRRPISSMPKSSPSIHRPISSQKPSRPVTAPSQSDLSDAALGSEVPSDVSLPSSPVSSNVLAPPSRLLPRTSQTELKSGQPSSPEEVTWSRRNGKVRSISTDSIPLYSGQSTANSSPVVVPKTIQSQIESEEQIRKKKGILRGILTRR
jgi:hypothetical protein